MISFEQWWEQRGQHIAATPKDLADDAFFDAVRMAQTSMPGWYSMAEQEPPEDDEYLCCDQHGARFIDRYKTSGKGFWTCEYPVSDGTEVRFWRYLPDAPTEGIAA